MAEIVRLLPDGELAIPAFETKRLAIEYAESSPVEHLQSYYTINVRPDS